MHTTTRRIGGDEGLHFTDHGRIPAQPLTFQVQIAVEPGTQFQHTSPLYRLNYRTGFVTPSTLQ